MRKILFLHSYFYPERAAGSYLGDDLRGFLAERGYLLEVITPMPSRGVSKNINRQYRSQKLEIVFNGKVIIHRFPMLNEGVNPLLRALRYLLCHIVHIWKSIQIGNCGLIFVSSTPPTQGAMSVLIKKIKKIPIVYSLQDIFPDSLVASGLTHYGSLLYKFGRVIEDFTYRNVDKIIVISEDFKQNIMNKGVPGSKIEVIYNWVDEKAVVPVSRDENKLFDELGISRDLFYVVYAGNLGHAQNIEIIIDAAHKLSKYKDIRFIIFGSGGLEKEFKGKADEIDLKNFLFFPLQSKERISEVYSLGDAAIVSCKPGSGKSAMPSKTWSIMSSGTAVLANFDEGTELQRIIESQGVGLFTKAGDLDKFCEAIIKLYENPVQTGNFGRNGRSFILGNLTKEIGTSKYLDVFNGLLKKD